MVVFKLNLLLSVLLVNGVISQNVTQSDTKPKDDDDFEYDDTVTCVIPPLIKNGKYVVVGDWRNKQKPGDKVYSYVLTVTCDPGFHLSGLDTVQCITDRDNQDPIPECLPYCKRETPELFNCGLTSDGQTSKCILDDGVSFLPSSIEGQKLPMCKRESPELLNCGAGSDGEIFKCIILGGEIGACLPVSTKIGIGSELQCGEVPKLFTTSVVGGRVAAKEEVPWYVSVFTKTTRPYMQICGGTLVSSRVVISAAHCFWNDITKKQPASNYAVAAGKVYRPWNDKNDVDAQKSDVYEIRIPPRYRGSATNFQDDIALVITSREIKFTTYVVPACLDFNYEFDTRQLANGTLGRVAGFGLSSEDGPASPLLNVVELPSLAIEECIDNADPGFVQSITSDKICAGYTNGTAVCRGDSGGGLTIPSIVREAERYYLRGIVSTAPKNDHQCNIYAVATFTHVFKHEYFIKKALEENFPVEASNKEETTPSTVDPVDQVTPNPDTKQTFDFFESSTNQANQVTTANNEDLSIKTPNSEEGDDVIKGDEIDDENGAQSITPKNKDNLEKTVEIPNNTNEGDDVFKGDENDDGLIKGDEIIDDDDDVKSNQDIITPNNNNEQIRMPIPDKINLENDKQTDMDPLTIIYTKFNTTETPILETTLENKIKNGDEIDKNIRITNLTAIDTATELTSNKTDPKTTDEITQEIKEIFSTNDDKKGSETTENLDSMQTILKTNPPLLNPLPTESLTQKVSNKEFDYKIISSPPSQYWLTTEKHPVYVPWLKTENNENLYDKYHYNKDKNSFNHQSNQGYQYNIPKVQLNEQYPTNNQQKVQLNEQNLQLNGQNIAQLPNGQILHQNQNIHLQNANIGSSYQHSKFGHHTHYNHHDQLGYPNVQFNHQNVQFRHQNVQPSYQNQQNVQYNHQNVQSSYQNKPNVQLNGKTEFDQQIERQYYYPDEISKPIVAPVSHEWHVKENPTVDFNYRPYHLW